MERRLYRSRDDRMIWGVCGGIARYFDIDPTIVRVIAVVLALASGAGIVAYIILAIVVPLESSSSTEPREIVRENVDELKQTAQQLGNEIRSSFAGEGAPADTIGTSHRSRNIVGIILVIAGGLFLLSNFRLFWWLRWQYLWPLILVGIGLLIIVGARRK